MGAKENKNTYNKAYKKENFDYIGFYTPKGMKAIAQAAATAKGMTLSEYMKDLIEKDTQ